ncbi:MAG TPA: hypothetical protein VGG31_00695, partial [Candidatus Dormibacteraeota bacterium]
MKGVLEQVAGASIEVAHQLPGRIRFDLPYAMLEPRRRAGIAHALSTEPGVTRHRFNVQARSLVIEHTGALTARTLKTLIARAPAQDPVAGPRSTRPSRRARHLAA